MYAKSTVHDSKISYRQWFMESSTTSASMNFKKSSVSICSRLSSKNFILKFTINFNHTHKLIVDACL